MRRPGSEDPHQRMLNFVIVFARQFLVKQTCTELVFSFITNNIHKYELQKFVGHTNNKDDSV